MKILKIKQYGLPRSGTNYFKSILENNYYVHVLPNTGGHKHEFYQEIENPLDIIVSFKNPYAWLVSMHKYQLLGQEQNLDKNKEKVLEEYNFKDFIMKPYEWGGRYYVETNMVGQTPIEHYNLMNKHWIDIKIFGKQNIIAIYENCLNNPVKYSKQIADKLSLKKRDEDFYVVGEKLGYLSEEIELVDKKEKTDYDKKNYYLNEEYLNFFNNNLIKYVNENLDKTVMSCLGYNYV